jgi:hypothetical protein
VAAGKGEVVVLGVAPPPVGTGGSVGMRSGTDISRVAGAGSVVPMSRADERYDVENGLNY